MALIDVVSPVPGTVKELLVAVGEAVNAGQELAIVESMKMEIPVESPAAGTLAELVIEPPNRVEEGDVILRIQSQT